jgi:hypothetical protein
MWYQKAVNWCKAHCFQIGYVVVIMVVGTLLHFTYDWLGRQAWVAAFAPINESVWEHLKMFFVPAFFYTLAGSCSKAGKNPGYWWNQMRSIVAGVLWIMVSFYTYVGITERNLEWLDIAIFLIAALIAGRVQAQNRPGSPGFAVFLLLLLWGCFVYFSYNVPLFLTKWTPGLFLE